MMLLIRKYFHNSSVRYYKQYSNLNRFFIAIQIFSSFFQKQLKECKKFKISAFVKLKANKAWLSNLVKDQGCGWTRDRCMYFCTMKITCFLIEPII